MKLSDILKHINMLVSNNSSYRLPFSKLEFYLDRAVDYINTQLNTTFKTIREFYEVSKINFSVETGNYYLGRFMAHPTFSNYRISDNLVYPLAITHDTDTGKYYALNSLYNWDVITEEMSLEYDEASSNLPTYTYGNTVDEKYYKCTPTIHLSEQAGLPSLSSIPTPEWVDLNIEEYPIASLDDTTLQGLFEYTELPDRYIRSVLVYYAAASYLEEEDETEDQYRLYMNRVDQFIIKWKGESYSCYDGSGYGI